MSQWTNVSGPAFWDLHVALSPHLVGIGQGSVLWEGSEAVYSRVGADEFATSGMALTPKGALATALDAALIQNGVLNFRVRMSSGFSFNDAFTPGTAGFYTRSSSLFGAVHLGDFFPESLATDYTSGFGPGFGELIFELDDTHFGVDITGDGILVSGLFLGAAIPAGNEALSDFFSCRLISIETDVALNAVSDFWTDFNLTRETAL